jgi:hypothetical protein
MLLQTGGFGGAKRGLRTRRNQFADSLENTSLEQRIVAELLRWKSLLEQDRSSVTANQSDVAGLIEYYLCEVFKYKNSAPSSGWWCDGVVELSISQPSDHSFLIVGVAYWAESSRSPFYLAPFEMDFELTMLDAIQTERIIVRFGSLDHTGQIKRNSLRTSTWLLVQRRPKRNEDWAFAVEIT